MSLHPLFKPLFLVLAILAVIIVGLGQTKDPSPAPTGAGSPRLDPDAASSAMQKGNWKEAYDVYSGLCFDAKTDGLKVGEYLNNSIQCLHNLGRQAETDALVEKTIQTHARNWRLHWAAATAYLHSLEHYGTIVAGEFVRGPHRGGTAKFVQSFERDRVRALQLMQQAMSLIGPELDQAQARIQIAGFYMNYSEMLLGGRGFYGAWRLGYLTDLKTLPDYEEGGPYYGWRRRGGYYGGDENKGAPVNPDGSPVFHKLPQSWNQAQTDGERWRWCLVQAMEMHPSMVGQVKFHFAQFLRNQFDVQTMSYYGASFGRDEGGDDEKSDSGPYAVKTLAEDETIARLANGVRRFKLPDEFNFIKIYQELAASKGHSYVQDSMERLAQIFEDRQQYPRAAEYWRLAIKTFGPGADNRLQKRLDQIVGNWGQFEPLMTQPEGKGATVEFRFRNAKKVTFTAHEIDVRKLLSDVKAYIKSRPKQLDWQQLDISNIGYRLVEKNQTQYLVKQVAQWDMDLSPRPKHFDRRVTVATPLQKPGAYLLVGKMSGDDAGGNTCRIVVWIADTALVNKPLDNQSWYYVADAVTGQPIPKANVEFFGYRQRWVQDNARRGAGTYQIDVQDFAEFTDQEGQLTLKPDKDRNQYQWIVLATTEQGRLAYLGFTGMWWNSIHDQEYKTTKAFFMSDRPVYRPAQLVKFKFWVGKAQYDQTGKSAMAGQSFAIRINNPKGDKVLEKNYIADEYGGFEGELELPRDATLGVYQAHLTNGWGGGSFRVEEYKKPEFEVKVQAPTEPVMLGEKITATIEAKYLFGAPVTEGKVKYKVLRSSHSARWYPIGRWDWFYGPGYWWFACDYLWYPGFREWGCFRPIGWWWGWHQPQQPELVAEVDTTVDKDGKVKVEIDTAVAKAVHSDQDHRYEITAEVTDQSRRVIVGQGQVLVARKPFKVYAWVDRGYYRTGDTIRASFCAQTLDNKPVTGKGLVQLFKVTYDKDWKPVETQVQKWDLDPDVEGKAQVQMKADQAGQYRLSYRVLDAKEHAIEGGYVFTIIGQDFDGSQFRFNDIELITDQREYKPGDKVKLQINANRPGSAVLLFVRPSNGVYLPPKLLRLTGKSTVEEVAVVQKDMPNFFIEAVTVSNARVHSETREVVVPPEKRVINVEVIPSAPTYKPGEQATVKVKLTQANGEPIVGSTVLTMYDKAVEYISGGSNVPDIREYFWKWRRHHQPSTQESLSRWSHQIGKSGEIAMAYLGVFGRQSVDDFAASDEQGGMLFGGAGGGAMRLRASKNARREEMDAAMPTAAPMAAMAEVPMEETKARKAGGEFLARDKDAGEGGTPMIEPTVRTQFADTAIWAGTLNTDKSGQAQIQVKMPENLTTWKTAVWAMGDGTCVGQGSVDVVTTKNLIVRLQAPRFFVEKDEVVLSANVHNYLKTAKKARVVLELEGNKLALMNEVFKAGRVDAGGKQEIEPILMPTIPAKTITIEAGGETRVDWRVKVVGEGQAIVRMKALTDEESDAMQMSFPVYVHGMLKTESFCGVIRPDKDTASITINVPKERKPEQSRLELRYSPTLAGAMIDALPYLVDYPYGCTEQTLNRFLPTVITQNVIRRMGVDLKELKDKRVNLNAQELNLPGKTDADRIQAGWQRMRDGSWRLPEERNPVYDVDRVTDMVKAGVERLTSMQCQDGGWGWFSGYGEQSYPHTTAYVVHGLQIAKDNDVALVPGVLERGIEWLKKYQARQIELLQLWDKTQKNGKPRADNLDAFVYMVLVDARIDSKEMQDYLDRDRIHLAVYAKAMFGLALHKLGVKDRLALVMQNIDQYLVQDDENQTAYLKLPENNWWWCWYGSEYEAQAYYLKLLSATDPKGEKNSRLVKYLLNNRRHATYWNSTRDTAVVIEAFADYIKASGEDKPEMTLEILIDGKQAKEVRIDRGNLFSFDNKLLLEGEKVTSGGHKIELRRKGVGPVYFNAYLTNFTLEDPIAKAGLEIKVTRKVYKLVKVDKTIKVQGSRGQALDQKVEKYERVWIPGPLDAVPANYKAEPLKSGDLLEVELTIESKNDYEYLVFEDFKAAGCEPVEVRSGYNGNDLGAYVEFRDERVVFFSRAIARGKHSVSYRLRAEIPGFFSALPARGLGMYAPELVANSDENKLRIVD